MKVPIVNLIVLACAFRSFAQTTQTSPWRPDQFPISYWCGPPEEFVTLDRFKEIKEANFTYVFPACGKASPELNHKILDLAQQVGLKAFIKDPQMPRSMDSRKARSDLNLIAKDYSKHPALAGYFITDEPGAGEFDALADVVANLKRRDPNHVAFINLLPNYAPLNALGTKDYESYLRDFVDKVHPFVISYDHYHFTQAGDGQRFFENLETVRKIALEKGLPFWNIVLVTQHGHYRNPTEPELRFEAMQTLAFGGKGLLWFTYWAPEADKTFAWHHAIIHADGSRDKHYEMIKQINADVLAIGGELLRAESVNVFLSQDAPKDSPLTVSAANITIGIFRGAGGKSMALLASRDYKNPSKSHLRINSANAQQFDPATGVWAIVVDEMTLPSAGAILIRW